MRDAVVKNGGNPEQIDAKCPADLVIDHCVSIKHKSLKSKKNLTKTI